ncbi:MAG TPA: phosphoribosylanthranilate isomerase [Thermoanaerobaculia bacterium]|nr:phosphoribosylanthranilate isomerase [Thermoanaerobaculia bacterium]
MHIPASEIAYLPRVKVCGLTNLTDALAAAALGADGLGFLVGLSYPSEDQLAPEKAGSLVAALPPFVSSVMVTHRTTPEEVISLWRRVKTTSLQLQGDFPIKQIPLLRQELPGIKVVKAVHVVGEDSIEEAYRASFFTDAVLLDSRTADRLGGTGQVHDWSLSRAIVQRLAPYPVFLAGGLTPENVDLARDVVRPAGFDANTGLCQRRGRKSVAKMERFLAAAKQPYRPD